ncbi:MAG TPA: ABC transporter permease, partial [Chloroflexota bacterium]|nr:ABC transporter permease [Chloroflexota bacterium]
MEALAFAGLAMCFTSMAPSFGFFNYFITLILTPMMLFSGVFFPVARLPWLVQDIVWLSPLFHAANLMRALAGGHVTPALAWDGLFLALIAAFACSLSLALMRRRLIV